MKKLRTQGAHILLKIHLCLVDTELRGEHGKENYVRNRETEKCKKKNKTKKKESKKTVMKFPICQTFTYCKHIHPYTLMAVAYDERLFSGI